MLQPLVQGLQQKTAVDRIALIKHEEKCEKFTSAMECRQSGLKCEGWKRLTKKHTDTWKVIEKLLFMKGDFHDQGGVKWIVIRRQLRGHNDTPFGWTTTGHPIGRPGVWPLGQTRSSLLTRFVLEF
jgi:hypothetical protein